MFYAGNKNSELHRTYIQNIYCKHCEENTEHLLVIYCKTFVLGVFYPFKWWASEKKGYIQCRKCGTRTDISEQNPDIPAKVLNYFSETKIPVRYKLPSYLLIGALILISSLMIFGFFSLIVGIFTPVNTKLRGYWEDEYKVYQLYIYKDKTYTAINHDTIVFGNYKNEKAIIDFPFVGKENKIPKNRAIPLVLKDSANDTFRFHKIRKTENFDEVYRKEYNRWRIKPTQPQTHTQIRTKILQYLEYEKFKYEKAIENKVEWVLSDPNEVVIFAMNGIQINGNSELKIRYLFYNDEDWIKATEILHREFPKNTVLNPNQENLFQRNVDFLKVYIQRVKDSDLSYLK